MRKTLRKYENVWLYIAFLLVAGFLAASRGCGQEFFAVLLFPGLVPLLLIFGLLIFCAVRGANGRIALVVQVMLTLGALMRAVFWTSYPDAFAGESLTILDFFIAEIVIFAVTFMYPVRTFLKGKRIFEILAGRKFTLVMIAAIALMYVLLFLSGTSYAGVGAWFSIGGFHIQLTEFIKLLFIICLAAIMGRDEKTPLAMLFYLINAVLMGVLISEFGTVMVMTFVFFIFLFIFPQKRGIYFFIGIAVIALMVAGIAFIRVSSSEYEYALEESDPRVFAAKFAGNLYNYALDTPEDVVTMDILGEMISKSVSGMSTERQAELGRAFYSIGQQITDGELALSDFADARDSEVFTRVADIIYEKEEKGIGEETAKKLTAVIRDYPAVTSLARLCEDAGFRNSYITQFCRDDFYSTDVLYRSAGGGLSHKIGRAGMNVYSKIISRVVLPNKALRSRFGFTDEDSMVPFQLAQAQSAMRVGGLTGARKHEFYYVPVMESDMIFSEMVSVYGFSMGFFVILLFMILFREGMKVTAKLEGKPFHRGLALGITLTFFVQALIIIAGNLNLFPLTGITLPFISDGTISMLVFAVLIGILIAVSYVPIVEENTAAGSSGEGLWQRLLSFPDMVSNTIKGNLWRVSKKDSFDEEDSGRAEPDEEQEQTDRQPETEELPEDFGGEEKRGSGPSGRQQAGKRGTKYTNWD